MSTTHDRRGAGHVERRTLTALPPEPRGIKIGPVETFVIGFMNGLVAGFVFVAWLLS